MKISARNAISEPVGDRVFHALVYCVLACVAAVCLLPLINVLACSLSSSAAVSLYRVYLWPVGLSLRGYQEMFKLPELWSGYGNSLFYTLVGTAINLIMTILAAYPLANKRLDGRNQIMALYTFTMFFSGGLIPTYLVVRSLGMVNTRWAMLIPGAISVYNMIIMRSFFIDSIPAELMEAADIDGANDWQQLLNIALPLSMPVLAVLGLYYAIGHWNSYFNALIYLSDYKKYPLQLILREYLLSDAKIDELLGGGSSFSLYASRMSEVMGLREVLKYAMIVVATLPMVLLYPLAQRYFIQGLMVGSIKG